MPRAKLLADMEAQVARLDARPRPAPPARRGHLEGYAMDGNPVRGAGAHGHATVLVSLVADRSTPVLAHTAGRHQRHASSAVEERPLPIHHMAHWWWSP